MRRGASWRRTSSRPPPSMPPASSCTSAAPWNNAPIAKRRALQTPANDRPRLRPVHFLLRPSGAAPMKPLLIIGLGNPLMGDDGVGAQLAESLAGRADADVLFGGTDLLPCAGELEGRQPVILI